MKLSDAQRALFEGKNFASIATLMPDGSPQVTPVWVEMDGDFIIVNTAEGRVKTANVTRDPRVAVSVVDHDDPYTMVAVRGIVTEVTFEGAEDGIDRLAGKYIDRTPYPWRSPDERRVILRILPEHVTGQYSHGQAGHRRARGSSRATLAKVKPGCLWVVEVPGEDFVPFGASRSLRTRRDAVDYRRQLKKQGLKPKRIQKVTSRYKEIEGIGGN